MPPEVKDMAQDFKDQTLLNPRLKNNVGHISLFFSSKDTQRMPDILPAQKHCHTYTLDLRSSKIFLTMFAMLGCIFLQGAFIYRISENNRQLAANDLKYRYVKMNGKIGKKGADGVGSRILGRAAHGHAIPSEPKSNGTRKP